MNTPHNPPNLPAGQNNANSIVRRSGPPAASPGQRTALRAIKKVIDARGHDPLVMPVDAVLDGLTAVDLTSIRRDIAVQRHQGNILFRCAQCCSPVYIAVSPAKAVDFRREVTLAFH